MAVEPGSPAEKAGILVRDDIIRFAGVAIERYSEIIVLLARQPVGSKVEVVVERDGSQIELNVEVR
jgi:S1-C subfamily serine protease